MMGSRAASLRRIVDSHAPKSQLKEAFLAICGAAAGVRQAYSAHRQLETFVGAHLREMAGDLLNVEDHMDVIGDDGRVRRKFEDEMGPLEPPMPKRDVQRIMVRPYVETIVDDLPAVGIQLQAKNRDFWDTYDRQIAEAQFRFGIALPLIAIIIIWAWQSGNWWWLVLLAAPVYLFILATGT